MTGQHADTATRLAENWPVLIVLALIPIAFTAAQAWAKRHPQPHNHHTPPATIRGYIRRAGRTWEYGLDDTTTRRPLGRRRTYDAARLRLIEFLNPDQRQEDDRADHSR